MKKPAILSFITACLLLLTSCDEKKPEGDKTKTDSTSTIPTTTFDSANNPYGLSKAPPEEAAPPGTGRDILIHISSGPEDKWKVCMALKLAEELAVDNNVEVYFDYTGAAVPLKSTEDFDWRPFPPAKKQLARLIEMKAKVAVSRASLESLWKKPTDVMPDVQVIEMGEMLDFAKGPVTVLQY